MRRLITFTSMAVLVLAGCASAGAPTSEPLSSSVTREPAEPTPAATATAQPLKVKVTFDGEACVYEGPIVFLDGTEVQFEFDPTAETADISAIVVGPVTAGMSRDEVQGDLKDHPAHVQPKWVMSYEAGYGPTTVAETISSTRNGQPVGGYLVVCVTSPETTDATFFAELLLVAAG
jgi:hypothetical protein